MEYFLYYFGSLTNVTRVTPLAKYEYCSWIGGGIVTAAEVAAARTHNRPGSIFRSNSDMIFDTFELNDLGIIQNVKLFIALTGWISSLQTPLNGGDSFHHHHHHSQHNSNPVIIRPRNKYGERNSRRSGGLIHCLFLALTLLTSHCVSAWKHPSIPHPP